MAGQSMQFTDFRETDLFVWNGGGKAVLNTQELQESYVTWCQLALCRTKVHCKIASLRKSKPYRI